MLLTLRCADCSLGNTSELCLLESLLTQKRGFLTRACVLLSARAVLENRIPESCRQALSLRSTHQETAKKVVLELKNCLMKTDLWEHLEDVVHAGSRARNTHLADSSDVDVAVIVNRRGVDEFFKCGDRDPNAALFNRIRGEVNISLGLDFTDKTFEVTGSALFLKSGSHAHLPKFMRNLPMPLEISFLKKYGDRYSVHRKKETGGKANKKAPWVVSFSHDFAEYIACQS